MDGPKRKYEKIWKIFQRMHSGLNQCNQITHSEHLCVWLLAKSRAHQTKKICSSWIRAHTELTSRASVTLLTQQMRDTLRKNHGPDIRKCGFKASLHHLFTVCHGQDTTWASVSSEWEEDLYAGFCEASGSNIYRDWHTISLNNCCCHHFLLEFCNPGRAVSSPIKCKIREDKGEVGRY